MGFTAPTEPEFDIDEWADRPYAERVRMMCDAWAMQGFGAPGVAYLFYVAKLVLYVGGFVVFAVTTEGVGGPSDIAEWWALPVVFGKAVLWTMLYESLGLGCGSGPLTGRYAPPVTAGAAFLRPGTIRLAPFRRLPLTAGHRRTLVDVGLYGGFIVLTVRALLADDLSRPVIAPIVIVAVLLGLRDKTVFLAARSEHYLLATFVLLFPDDLWAGEKAVQAGLWFWAATSKLNHHFPSVIAVMMSNNPFLRSRALRRRLYRGYPDDMRGSAAAAWVAHGATVVEYVFPVLLVLGTGGWVTTVALIVMVSFHTIILTSFPLGVPLEWNVFFIYSALALFGVHADVRVWDIDSAVLAAVLVVCLVVVPLVGNLAPDKVSFLPAMRYYAGNWATSAWLMRPGTAERIQDSITTVAATPRRQLQKLYGEDGDIRAILGRSQAFRAMHLHGRAFASLVPRAVGDVDAFEVIEGELIAGLALGWNFGDGHLHHEQLLGVLQEHCGFEPGEVRVVMVESQPLLRPDLHWRIVDAADGLIEEGHVLVADLLAIQPWGGTP